MASTTPASTKQMITRSRVSNSTEFQELSPRKRTRRTPLPPLVLKDPEDCTSPSLLAEPEECTTSADDHEEDTESICSEESEIESFSDDECTLDSSSTYEEPIDFDDAHDAWMANKKRGPMGNFVYICGYVLPNHKLCQKDCCDKIGLYSGCKKHYMWEEKIHKNFIE